jgi:hypothetical protein
VSTSEKHPTSLNNYIVLKTDGWNASTCNMDLCKFGWIRVRIGYLKGEWVSISNLHPTPKKYNGYVVLTSPGVPK